MPSALRRLAADYAVLHDDLPPNYLFPPDDSSDDLTQLSILIAGPHGTPYSQGLWRLHLRMPEDYPKSPPKATFRTRIWHPNVEEATGAVCVDTLKRDWRANLTLKDVLITISCLLIYPNPDSALNSAAGALLQEDYDAFARQAKLMTSIHAPVPADTKNAVTEAKLRGEDAGTVIQEQQQEEGSSSLRPKKGTRVQSVTMKKKTSTQNKEDGASRTQLHASATESEQIQHPQGYENPPSISEDDDNENNENDPSLSPSPVKFVPPSPRKNAHGKRPLSVLTMPMEDPFITTSSAATAATTTAATTTATAMETDEEGATATTQMTASEKNIAANQEDYDEDYSSSQRKSPKLFVLNKGTNSSGRIRDDIDVDNTGIGIGIFEDGSSPDLHGRTSGDGKENQDSSLPPGPGSKEQLGQATRKQQPNCNNNNNNNNNTHNTSNTSNNYNNPPPSILASSASTSSSTSATPATAPSSSKGRKLASPSSSTGMRKVSRPRVGIRRL